MESKTRPIMTANEIFERMKLPFFQKFLVRYFPSVREKKSEVIQKYDYYQEVLEILHQVIDEWNQKLHDIEHISEEIVNKAVVNSSSNRKYQKTLKRYKKRIENMELEICGYISLLVLSQKMYGSKNLYRLTYSILKYFGEGYKNVALLKALPEHEWDFEILKEELNRENIQPYYILTGNRIDKDELSAFNIMPDHTMSGIVINNSCTIERMLRLINEYYKYCNIYEVRVEPLN